MSRRILLLIPLMLESGFKLCRCASCSSLILKELASLLRNECAPRQFTKYAWQMHPNEVQNRRKGKNEFVKSREGKLTLNRAHLYFMNDHLIFFYFFIEKMKVA